MGMTKGRIAQYREKLDKTLESRRLTDGETLKALVKDHILRSQVIDGYIDDVIAKRTAELSNLLDMLRSASDSYNRSAHHKPHASWKLKQDNEDFRVMYREGPQGSPFHTLLVEGYIDAPIDVCLCVSWEAALYPTWFPETRIPTFKIIAAKCLQKVRIGEQISLVRVKLSWPLSNREAVMHFCEFEYFEDDLIVVLMQTVPDEDGIQGKAHGFTNAETEEAGDAVRVDMVGGFALQKVTEERSYFRINLPDRRERQMELRKRPFLFIYGSWESQCMKTIANVDIKLDIVPPSLINFISRQLIGSSFRLYQKTIASISKGDKNFGKALIDPLYKQIHEGIYLKGNPERNLETGIVQGDTCTDSEEHNQTAENEFQSKGQPNQGNGNISTPTSLKYEPAINWKASTEIEEVRFHECKGAEQDAAWEIAEENNRLTNQPNDHDFEGPSNFNNEKAHLSLPVEQALGTLEKAISMIRDVRLNTQAWAESGVFNKETSPRMEGNEPKPSTVEDCWTSSYKEALSNLSQGRTVGRTSQQLKNSFNLKNSRHGLSSFSEEVNPQKIAPASPKKSVSTESDRSLQVASHFIENGPAEAAVPGKTIDDGSKIITDDDDLHDDRSIEQKESLQRKKWKLCCFLTG